MLRGHFNSDLEDSLNESESSVSERPRPINNLAENVIEEVEDEQEVDGQSSLNYSALALIEKLSKDVSLRKKLDKVIHILSSIKHDFN